MSKANFTTTIYYPVKTIFTLFWFAFLGLVAFIVNVSFFGATVAASRPAAVQIAGMNGENSISPVVLRSDADLFASMEHIDNPRQPLKYTDSSVMDSFVKDLQNLNYGKRTQPVRILHYGDSILTTDELSGRVRAILQHRFGDGGHGFVLMLRPWRWYHHLGVTQGGVKDLWRVHPFTASPVADGLYGLGGVAFIAPRGTRAKAWVATADEGLQGREVNSFDISYLKQPKGGSFSIFIDGKLIESVKTAADKKEVAHHIVKVKFGRSKLRIKTNNDGIVRVFGVIMENGEPGVVYDSLAVNGASGTNILRMNPLSWKKEIAYRKPSLVIIMMGANEGANRFLNIEEYKKYFSKVLSTLKAASPHASCLVVGALDQAKKAASGGLESKKMPIKLSSAQKEVAFNKGCAFFDTFNAMGGSGSMAKWCTTGYGGGDFIHPTQAGSVRIGNWLAESLLYEYQTHKNKKVKK